MADFVSALWTNFAKTGNPNEPELPPHPFGEEYIPWLPFDEVDYNYYYMDRYDVRAPVEYRQKNFAFYTPYMEYVSGLQITGGGPEMQKIPRVPGTARALPDCSVYPENNSTGGPGPGPG